MDNKLKTVDAETLLSTPMSKTMFIVDGLISQGVNVISGASKIGKSWLMLWLGLQAAQGNSVWGLPTLQCDVLYSQNSWRTTACAGCAFTTFATAAPACCWPTAFPSSTFRSGWATATLPPRRTSTPTWITSPRSPRHRRWRQGLLYRRAATSEVVGGRAKPKIRRKKQKSALITYS